MGECSTCEEVRSEIKTIHRELSEGKVRFERLTAACESATSSVQTLAQMVEPLHRKRIAREELAKSVKEWRSIIVLIMTVLGGLGYFGYQVSISPKKPLGENPGTPHHERHGKARDHSDTRKPD